MAQVKDVVCGMWVDPETAPAKIEYQGKTYYFCAPGCLHLFKENPEKYIHGTADTGGHGHDMHHGSHEHHEHHGGGHNHGGGGHHGCCSH